MFGAGVAQIYDFTVYRLEMKWIEVVFWSTCGGIDIQKVGSQIGFLFTRRSKLIEMVPSDNQTWLAGKSPP